MPVLITAMLIIGVIVIAALAVLIFMYILIPVLSGIGWLVAHIFRYITGTIRDIFRAIGAIPAIFVFAVLSVLNIVVGRWSAASHFGSNMQYEFKTFLTCLYRVVLGHPLRLVGMGSLLEGLEQRVPAAFAESPGADRPSKKRVGQFEGYTIVGSLPGGGSGGKLYVADPTQEKRAKIIKRMGQCPERVVIKAFAIADGSSLPQIVRESRALECAKTIGLVVEHELTDERFFYVMPYVPGDHLGAQTRQLHARFGEVGLAPDDLRIALGYVSDVLSTLNEYHQGGLWHKDIKPENIIIHANRAHIVDLGLVTPLRSAMTLTTHGTEYFRDPEMVRLALRGVKVHEVNGVKFDLYATGAVLFFILEDTFPMHGGLSTISRRCPDAVKWIVRRAMTDYNNRYESAAMMLADIEAVRTNADMFAMKPADLPSMKGQVPQGDFATPPDQPQVMFPASAGVGAEPQGPWAQMPPKGSPRPPRSRRMPRIRIVNWWTGAYRGSDGDAFGERTTTPQGTPEPPRHMDDEIRHAAHEFKERIRSLTDQVKAEASQRGAQDVRDAARHARRAGAEGQRSAREQVAAARSRARATRVRVRSHRAGVRAPGERVSGGMVIAAILVLGVTSLSVLGFLTVSSSRRVTVTPGGLLEDLEIQIPEVTLAIEEAIAVAEELSKIKVTFTGSRLEELRTLTHQLPPNLLVINDHPNFRDPEVRTRIDSIKMELGRIGLRPLALTDPTSGEVIEAEAEAELRTIVETIGPVGPREFINAQESLVSDQLTTGLVDVGCVLWIRQSPNSPEDLWFWVITPGSLTSQIDDKILGFVQEIDARYEKP